MTSKRRVWFGTGLVFAVIALAGAVDWGQSNNRDLLFASLFFVPMLLVGWAVAVFLEYLAFALRVVSMWRRGGEPPRQSGSGRPASSPYRRMFRRGVGLGLSLAVGAIVSSLAAFTELRTQLAPNDRPDAGGLRAGTLELRRTDAERHLVLDLRGGVSAPSVHPLSVRREPGRPCRALPYGATVAQEVEFNACGLSETWTPIVNRAPLGFWRSSAPSVATVEHGMVRIHADGEATLTWYGLLGTTAITVLRATPASMAFDFDRLVVEADPATRAHCARWLGGDCVGGAGRPHAFAPDVGAGLLAADASVWASPGPLPGLGAGIVARGTVALETSGVSTTLRLRMPSSGVVIRSHWLDAEGRPLPELVAAHERSRRSLTWRTSDPSVLAFCDGQSPRQAGEAAQDVLVRDGDNADGGLVCVRPGGAGHAELSVTDGHLSRAVAVEVNLTPLGGGDDAPTPPCEDPRRTGPGCNQCKDATKTGGDCDVCIDETKTGARCDRCKDPRRKGSQCDACAVDGMALPTCETCADDNRAGPACRSCRSPLWALPSCHACKDERRQWPECTSCAAPFIGPECRACENGSPDPGCAPLVKNADGSWGDFHSGLDLFAPRIEARDLLAARRACHRSGVSGGGWRLVSKAELPAGDALSLLFKGRGGYVWTSDDRSRRDRFGMSESLLGVTSVCKYLRFAASEGECRDMYKWDWSALSDIGRWDSTSRYGPPDVPGLVLCVR